MFLSRKVTRQRTTTQNVTFTPKTHIYGTLILFWLVWCLNLNEIITVGAELITPQRPLVKPLLELEPLAMLMTYWLGLSIIELFSSIWLPISALVHLKMKMTTDD